MKKEDKVRLSALNKAIKLLSYGDKTSYDLREKLKEDNFEAGDIEKAITELERVGLLNDDRWLENNLAYIKNAQPRGLYRVKMDMERHGISGSQVEKKWQEAEMDEEKMAKKLAENRLRLYGDKTYKNKQKVARFLGGRGFSWTVIATVLEDLFGNTASDI